jgi:hypothetical protein
MTISLPACARFKAFEVQPAVIFVSTLFFVGHQSAFQITTHFESSKLLSRIEYQISASFVVEHQNVMIMAYCS